MVSEVTWRPATARGRDHGLAPFRTYRESVCGLSGEPSWQYGDRKTNLILDHLYGGGGAWLRQSRDLPRGSAGEGGDGPDLQLPHQAAVRGAAGRGQVLLHPLQHGRVPRVLQEPAAAPHEEDATGYHLRQHVFSRDQDPT